MSKVEVDKVIPQSGTTLTIGDSGDTINLVGTLQSNGSPLPGDISEVVAGTGLSGGGTSGAVTINIEAAQPTITSLGTITSFRSTGIDDNADATAITIDSSEQVGIGTSSPSSLLHIFSSAPILTIQDGGTHGTSSAPRLSFNDGSSVQGFIDFADDGTMRIDQVKPNNLTIHTNNVERMRITSAGLVGIGTSSPSKILHCSSNDPVIRLTDTDTGATHNLSGSSSARNFDLEVDTGSTSGSPRFALKIHDGLYYTQTKTEAVFNEESNDVDFRVESNGNANMLFVDGGNDKIGIGNNNPNDFGSLASDLVIGTTSGEHGLTIVTGTGNSARMQFSDNTSSPFVGAIEYSHGTNDLMFYTDGSQKMKITSAGNVGIGTSSPTEKLEVSDGKLLIKTTSGAAFLEIVTPGGSADSVINFGDSADNNVGIIAYEHDNNALKFITNTSERMRITSDGKILLNRTSTAENTIMDIKHTSYGLVLDADPASGTKYHVMFSRNGGTRGNITSTSSAVQYNTTSDYRLKENVNYDFDATSRLKQLKPSRFNFIADADTTVDGFIAHEVSSIVPEAVTGTKDAIDTNGKPIYQGIDQSKLVPLLVKTIQELEARITTLENA